AGRALPLPPPPRTRPARHGRGQSLGSHLAVHRHQQSHDRSQHRYPPHGIPPSSPSEPDQVNSPPPLPAISFLLFLNVLLIEMRDMHYAVQTVLASFVPNPT